MERRIPLQVAGIDWDSFPGWAERAARRENLSVLGRTEGPGTHWWRLVHADREIHLCYDETLDQVWLEPDGRGDSAGTHAAIADALERVAVSRSR